MRRVLLFSAFVFCFAANASAQPPRPGEKVSAATPSTAALPAAPSVSPAAANAARASFARLPLSFEENAGQTDSRVKFTSRGGGYSLFLTSDEAVIALSGGTAPKNCVRLTGKLRLDCASAPNSKPEGSVLWMKMLGANSSARIEGTEILPGKINYYTGNDPAKWRTGVRQFGRVSYRGIYPGVDLIYYGNQQQLESDFVIEPGASARSVEFEVTGAKDMRLDSRGDLVLATNAGEVQLLRPSVYQTLNGKKQEVSGRYVLRGKDRIGFEVGSYDGSNPLVIDPVFVYSTYLGGSGGDIGNAVAIDSTGAAFITGQGSSLDFPGSASTGVVAQTTPYAFVTKFDPTGNTLVYSTLLRGSTGSQDSGNGIGLDASGNAYVAGTTSDADFPLLNPFQATIGDDPLQLDSEFGSLQSGFVAGLDSSGNLIYSTFFGGRNDSDQNYLTGLAADSAGNAYVTGYTNSQNFPTLLPVQSTNNGFENAVVAKFDKNGQLVYSTYLGGSSDDQANAIAVDATGNAYVTGQTSSANFPVQTSPAPFQAAQNNFSTDTFVSKLSFNSGLQQLSLANSTYLGGSSTDIGMGIAVDTASNVYLTGQTSSTTAPNAFPTQAPIFAAHSGVQEAFVTKLNPTFTALLYSTFLGGTSSQDSGQAIALDGANPPNAFVTGTTSSTDFPVVKPLQATIGSAGISDAFVTEINGTGTAVTYSTFLGGLGADQGLAIAVDSTGNAYVTGSTASANFPVLSSSGVASRPFQDQLQGTFGGGNAFVTKISPSAAASGLNFFPPAENYADTGLNQAGLIEPFTLSNNSGSSITINSFATTGTNPLDFTVISGPATTCTNGQALAAGASCTVAVQFTPKDQDARSAQLTVNSSPASSSVANLSGFGAVPEVSLNLSVLAFGSSLPLNVTAFNGVTLTNTGGGILHVGSVQISGADASAFSIAFNTCATVAPHSTCFIDINFIPTTAKAYSASLLINNDAAGSPQTLSMTGTGVGQVNVSPTSIEYRGQLLNTSSTDQQISVTNGSGGVITLSSIVAGGHSVDFPIDTKATSTSAPICVAGLQMQPGVSCNFFAFFQPTVGTAFDGDTATYTFNWTGTLAGSKAVTVMGTGETGVTLYQNSLTVPSDYVGATERQLGFDQIFNGTASPITVTSIVLSGSAPQDYTLELDNSCSVNGTIAANSVCFFDGQFAPSATGTRSVTATINYTPPSGSSLVLNVTGIGLPGPVQFAGAFNFGTEIVGLKGPVQRMYLQNTQKLPLHIATLSAVTGTNAADFLNAATSTCASGITVPAGGKCYVDLQFAPSAAGSRTASLTITDDGPGSPRTLNMSGTGIAPAVTVTPATLDFGNVALINPISSQNTVTATFYLINSGNTATTITAAPMLTTASGTPFTISAGAGTTCTLNQTVLPQGGTCAVVVTFKPTGPGAATANSVTLTDTVGGPHTVQLAGTGVTQGVLSVSGATTFNQAPSTTTSPAQIVTVTNSGSGPLTLNAIAINGTNSANFAIAGTGTTCTAGMTLPALASNTCAIALTFTAPATPGSFTANLLVTASLGNTVAGNSSTRLTGSSLGLSISPAAPLDFGTVPLGTEIDFSTLTGSFTGVTITNNFASAVTITTIAPQTAGDFTVLNNFCTSPISPNGTCSFDIAFSPTVTTLENNNILISYTGAPSSPLSVAVKGTGSASLLAVSNPLNVTTPVGTQANPTITLGNGTASTITVVSVNPITGTNAADYALGFSFCSFSPLSPAGTSGSSCTISLTFNPLAPGANRTAQFTVTYTVGANPAQQTLTVNLNGNATAAQVSLSPTPPTPLTFANQITNTQSLVLNVVMTNTGNAPLLVSSLQITGPNSSDFAIAPEGFSSSGFNFLGATLIAGCQNINYPGLAPGASCPIAITFTPSLLYKTTARSAILTITDNAYPSTTQTVNLAGNAASGNVTVSPTSLNFPDTNVGLSVTQTVLVTNTSSAAVNFTNVTFGTTAYSVDATQTLNACSAAKPLTAFTGSCVVYIKFTPVLGSNSDTATIHTSGGNPTVLLSGTGKSSVVSVSPNPLSFPTGQLINTQSSPLGVTLTNGTASSITISSTPTVTGDFLLGTNTCTSGATITAGSTCTVNVIFKPTAVGARTGTLTINDSGSPASFAVPLSGTGVAVNVTITKSHAGNFTVGQTGTYTITVTNSGGSPTTGTTTVTDTLPVGMTFNSNTNSGVWTCVAGTPVSCTSSAAIAASGGASAFNLVVNVAAAAAGTPINSATVTSVGDTGTTNKTATDPTTVNFPAPTITTLSPTSATAGGALFTLTVNGTNFVSGSVVNFNGAAATTTFVSATQVTASITAAQIATAGTFNVSVTNPAPGGGTSGNATFTVNNPVPVATSLSPSSATVGGAAFTLTVNGSNFNHSSVVTFNGTARTTTFVSATQITIQVTVADISALGSPALSVTNPAPGGGTSGTLNLPVTNPPPTVTTIAPTSATAGGAAFTLTVNGTGFVSGAVVNFNGNSRTTTFVNSTQVTAAILAADIATAGTFNVNVTNPAPGGGTSGNAGFTVNNPVPTITTIAPNSALAGGAAFTLTVNGTNFNTSSVVKFNGTAAVTTFVNATQITAAIPAADIATAGSFNVTVTNPTPGGGTSGNSAFTVNNPAPAITTLSPSSTAKGGAAFTLTVNGSGFVSTSVVNYNGSARTTTFVSATQITAAITAADIATAGSFNVSVTNAAPGGGTSGNSPFAVNNPVPTITTLSPSSALVGGAAFTLTVNGTNFVSGATVSFNGNNRTTTFVSATQVTAAITAGDLAAAGSFNVVVTNPAPGGGASGNSAFAVNNPVPSITTLSPSSAIVGGTAFTLTVNGTNFVSGATVSFNGSNRTTTFVNSTQVTAAITSGDIATAGTFDVVVTNPAPGGGASGASPFAVNNPAPTISSLSPNGATVGGAGFTLTVNGTGFVSTSVVKFNGNAKTTTFVSSTQLTALILSSDIATVGPANVTVTNAAPGGGSTTNFVFTIASQPNPAPTLTLISPASGTAGQPVTLTLTGTGFIAGSIVNFGSNGDTGGTASNGGATLTITIPANQLPIGGTVQVTVTNPSPGGGTSAAQTFTINNPAPAITTISPSSATVGAAAFTLTVNGTGFVSSSVVKFNGVARVTTFVSATQLTAAILAGDLAATGNFPVTVTNVAPGGGLSGGSNFAVTNPAPTITTLAPSSATAGAAAFTLTVNGTGFVSGSVVNFNGTAKTTTFVSATQLTATITAPDIAAAGTLNVSVTNPAPGGGTSGNSTFTVNNPAPTITTLSPTSALAGGAAFTLTVNGTGFNSSSVAHFNGAAVATTFVSATQVTAAIPAPAIAAAGTFNVSVTNPAPGGGTSANSSFAVNNPAPTITTLSPTSALAGGATFTITVNGTGFVSASAVKFNGTAVTTTFVSATQVTASIPAAQIAAAGSFNVTVTNPAPGGGTSANSAFAVNNPVPTITTLSPASATKGGAAFTLTVNGTNFVSTSVVNFNGSAKTTTYVSATQITAAIAAADITTAGSVNVTVTNPAPGGGTSGTSAFTVNNPVPVLTSVSPTSAVVGGAAFTLTVNGTGFLSGAVVNFNGNARTTTFVNATQVTAAITAADILTGGVFNVTVTNPAPTSGPSAALTFSVGNPVPTITTLSPANAAAGGAAFTLTVNGTGFITTSVVNVNGTAVATTFVNATQITAPVTAAQIAAAGTLNITVTNPTPGGGTSIVSAFAVNNPVPTATSLSPSSATKGAAFTLTVTGANFNASSVVNFNGAAKSTTFMDATHVKASITATDTAAAGTFNVTVTNPAPGGGTSANQSFSVVAITAAQDASTAGTIPVNAGTPATVKIDYTATSAFPSAITVACVVPTSLTGATCSVSPTTIPAGGTSGSSTITINAVPKPATTTSSTPIFRIGGKGPWNTPLLWFAGLALLSMLGMLGAVQQGALRLGRSPVYLSLVLLILAAGALAGCTNMASGPTPTPTGPATIMVTATTADGATLPPVTVNINVAN